jgi:hypothetical protein
LDLNRFGDFPPHCLVQESAFHQVQKRGGESAREEEEKRRETNLLALYFWFPDLLFSLQIQVAILCRFGGLTAPIRMGQLGN